MVPFDGAERLALATARVTMRGRRRHRIERLTESPYVFMLTAISYSSGHVQYNELCSIYGSSAVCC